MSSIMLNFKARHDPTVRVVAVQPIFSYWLMLWAPSFGVCLDSSKWPFSNFLVYIERVSSLTRHDHWKLLNSSLTQINRTHLKHYTHSMHSLAPDRLDHLEVISTFDLQEVCSTLRPIQTCPIHAPNLHNPSSVVYSWLWAICKDIKAHPKVAPTGKSYEIRCASVHGTRQDLHRGYRADAIRVMPRVVQPWSRPNNTYMYHNLEKIVYSRI